MRRGRGPPRGRPLSYATHSRRAGGSLIRFEGSLSVPVGTPLANTTMLAAPAGRDKGTKQSGRANRLVVGRGEADAPRRTPAGVGRRLAACVAVCAGRRAWGVVGRRGRTHAAGEPVASARGLGRRVLPGVPLGPCGPRVTPGQRLGGPSGLGLRKTGTGSGGPRVGGACTRFPPTRAAATKRIFETGKLSMSCYNNI
jgi:hypothetical protein